MNSLTSGAVEAVYQSPNKGRVSLYLLNGNGDVLIVMDARFDWEDETNYLVLNSKHAGQPWIVPDEVHPKGFPFPCCGYVSTITVRVEIAEDFTMALKLQRCLAYPYNKKFPSDDINDVKVLLHCVIEEGKEFRTEHVLGTKE